VKVGRLSSEPNGEEAESTFLSHDLTVRGETIGQLQVAQLPNVDEEAVELVAAVAEQLSTHLESLRLAERTERVLADTETQASRLATLNELSQALASAATLDEVYRVTAVRTPNIVPAERISLAILGGDGKYFEIRALHGDKGATKVGDVLSGDGTVLATAVQQNRVVVVNRSAETGMPGIESFMVAPLTAGGRTFGTLNAGSTQVDAFDSRDEILLLQIASLLASTLETRRLFTETIRRAEELAVISRMARTRADELTILNEMGQALTSLSDEKSVINIVQRHTSQLMPAEGFHVALYDEVHDEVFITVFAEGQEIVESGLRRRSGNGITEYVLNTRQPLLIKERVSDFVEEHGIDSIGQIAKSWLGVPMLAGEKAIGILAVQSFGEEGVYDEHDRDLLTAAANQAAIALENARLFAQVQERARRERILREITTRVKSSADVDSVMRTAAQEVGRALGRQTFIYLANSEQKETDHRDEDK
jgi:GAF domain-containing protein